MSSEEKDQKISYTSLVKIIAARFTMSKISTDVALNIIYQVTDKKMAAKRLADQQANMIEKK